MMVRVLLLELWRVMLLLLLICRGAETGIARTVRVGWRSLVALTLVLIHGNGGGGRV